jgi:ubiquinone/menaquinone biosynthesis C-methylase UbiE
MTRPTHRTQVDLARADEIDAHFEAIGSRYEALAFTGAGLAHVSRRELDAVRSALGSLPPGSPVLDVGVGTGRVSRTLSVELGLNVTGVDAVGEMAAAARRNVPVVPVVQARLPEPLPFADDRFAAAVAIRVLKWVPRWVEGVAEMARVVRPGGLLVAEITNRVSLAALGYRGAPVSKLARREVERAFRSQGLDVLRWWAGTRLPHGVWMHASTTRRALPPIWVERALDRVVGTVGARSLICCARKSS